ncbi:hypothetical protein [Phytomonospora endophytica]|uniref:Uncharacterized protein n=1 Tax=Phytomonospora endophytica TaxID=714109 RepID=A0A841FJG3_9ACTN|nr:hypothetical protein [Phytomonospora endophytica]MBB6035083.1 hypothetical protein [Phytomonospora endophytica]GIG64168.1 hypothetical protein Pen01_04630 [Phytomonospora endophytica]
MCVSSLPARLSDTIVYLGRTSHPAHGDIEVLGYQNTAASEADGPNAMLLHLPAGARMTSGNFINVGRVADPLADMAAAVAGPIATARGGIDWMSAEETVEVFEHDVYTVVLAGDPALIPAALERVPVERRPVITGELLDFYARTFPGYTIALCCFDNADALRARPLMLWYEPADPGELRMPGLDCHSGGVPVPGMRVERDHLLLFGGDEAPEETTSPVTYRPGMRHRLRRFLPGRVHGIRVNEVETPELFANGDFVLPLDDLRAGRFRVRVG